MEALSRKAEKEKLAELEAMLADATQDITGVCVAKSLMTGAAIIV